MTTISAVKIAVCRERDFSSRPVARIQKTRNEIANGDTLQDARNTQRVQVIVGEAVHRQANHEDDRRAADHMLARVERGDPFCSRDANDNVIATPTMNRNDGKIMSVAVAPFHCACRSCAIDEAIAAGIGDKHHASDDRPRNTSSDTSRESVLLEGIVTTEAGAVWVTMVEIDRRPTTRRLILSPPKISEGLDEGT